MAGPMLLWSPRATLRVGARVREQCSRGVSSTPSLGFCQRSTFTRGPITQSLSALACSASAPHQTSRTFCQERSAVGSSAGASARSPATTEEAKERVLGEGELAEDGEIPPEVADLFDTLRGEALRRLDEFGPIHLFSLCWAYSTARLLDDDLHKQVTDAALRLGAARDAEGFDNKRGSRDRARDGKFKGKRGNESRGPSVSTGAAAELAGGAAPAAGSSSGGAGRTTEVGTVGSQDQSRSRGSVGALSDNSIGSSGVAAPSEAAAIASNSEGSVAAAFGGNKEAEAPVTNNFELRETPKILAEGKHWMALYKPPFWLVSVDSKEAMKAAASTPFEDEDEGDADDLHLLPEGERKRPRVHKWIMQNLAPKYPVCTDSIEAFGLLHRLDVQTSGILMCAKSYVGAYWLRLQWCAYTVDKEYVCLVHGWVDRSEREIHKRIRIDKKKAENSRRTISTHCTISPSGKPSYTELVTLGHFIKPDSDMDGKDTEGNGELSKEHQRYSLVALKLHTGRTHQIRVHMLSIGHPLVCDSKYAEDLFPADRMWCTRIFLHTHRIGFQDTPNPEDDVSEKRQVDVCCPLPADLRESLGMLKPVDTASQQMCEHWLAGESDRLLPYESYAEEAHGKDRHKKPEEEAAASSA